MKKIGVIGGLGPEATIDYYRRIIDGFNRLNTGFDYPDIIVYSVNLSKLMAWMKAENYEEATNYLAEKIEILNRAGAEFAVLSANTPHLMFDQIKAKSNLPLISIVEATCSECVARGSKRAGLIGTAFTMESTFYHEVFKKYNIEIIVPDKKDRVQINYKLFKEIELGIFKDETRDQFIGIIEKMVHEQQIDSLILGCTEFPLLLTEEYYAGIPMLNTTQIHVDAIIKYCLSTDING